MMVMMVVFGSLFLQVAVGPFSRDSYRRRWTAIPIATMTCNDPDAGGKDVDTKTIITVLGFCNECISGRLWTHEFISSILVVIAICIVVVTMTIVVVVISWEEDFATVFSGWGPGRS